MTHTANSRFEARGIRAPKYLVEYARAELGRIGEVTFALRVGAGRSALIRIAADLTALRGSIALLEADYRAHGQRAA